MHCRQGRLQTHNSPVELRQHLSEHVLKKLPVKTPVEEEGCRRVTEMCSSIGKEAAAHGRIINQSIQSITFEVLRAYRGPTDCQIYTE